MAETRGRSNSTHDRKIDAAQRAVEEARGLPEGWWGYDDARGYRYYHHETSGDTTYEFPKFPNDPELPEPSGGGGGGGGGEGSGGSDDDYEVHYARPGHDALNGGDLDTAAAHRSVEDALAALGASGVNVSSRSLLNDVEEEDGSGEEGDGAIGALPRTRRPSRSLRSMPSQTNIPGGKLSRMLGVDEGMHRTLTRARLAPAYSSARVRSASMASAKRRSSLASAKRRSRALHASHASASADCGYGDGAGAGVRSATHNERVASLDAAEASANAKLAAGIISQQEYDQVIALHRAAREFEREHEAVEQRRAALSSSSRGAGSRVSTKRNKKKKKKKECKPPPQYKLGCVRYPGHRRCMPGPH